MTDSAREQILNSIRRGVNNPELREDRSRQLPSFTPSAYQATLLVDRWRAELEALTGRVYGPLAPAAAIEQLIGIVDQYQPRAVIAWDDADLPLHNLSGQLKQVGVEVALADNFADANVRKQLAQIQVGITGAIAGLADTGSIIVDSGSGRSRTASLLPPVHVALLPVSELYPDLPTWMALQGGDLLTKTANLTIISGPSKTADIELNLVLGVHGPGEVHVILLD
jgi:L-lactate dehydrogenase complex protein LldG